MAYKTIIQQLLDEPERMQEGLVNALVEDIEAAAVKQVLELVKPGVEKAVKDRLKNFKAVLLRDQDFLPTINIKTWFKNEEVGTGDWMIVKQQDDSLKKEFVFKE